MATLKVGDEIVFRVDAYDNGRAAPITDIPVWESDNVDVLELIKVSEDGLTAQGKALQVGDANVTATSMGLEDDEAVNVSDLVATRIEVTVVEQGPVLAARARR